jgi:hypothetical protein
MLPRAVSEITEYRRFKLTRDQRDFAFACGFGVDGLACDFEPDPFRGGDFDPNSCLIRPNINGPLDVPEGKQRSRVPVAQSTPLGLRSIISEVTQV